MPIAYACTCRHNGLDDCTLYVAGRCIFCKGSFYLRTPGPSTMRKSTGSMLCRQVGKLASKVARSDIA